MSHLNARSHAVVIVLGDSGRSPRMQFHAQSLADMEEIDRVSLIGYAGETCNEAISNNVKIRDCRINASNFQCIEFLRGYSSVLHAILKGLLLVYSLVRLFFSVAGQHTTRTGHIQTSMPISFIIVQNPPATPVILAAFIYRAMMLLCAFLTCSSTTVNEFSICMDWHNLGFTLYYDRYKPTHILVRVCYYLEYVMAKLTDTNLCVSKAMRDWLTTNYGIESTVFYDRPPKSVFQKFKTNDNDSKGLVYSPDSRGEGDSEGEMVEGESCCSVPLTARHDLLHRLDLTDNHLFSSLPADTPFATPSDITEMTIQTYRHRTTGDIHLRPDRAALLISSTSWTPDEDFSLLTNALINLDKDIARRRGSESPRKTLTAPSETVWGMRTRVVVVITGKGPLKEQFMASWNKSQEEGSPTRLNYISLVSVWLEIDDYPLMVGCADMGICLHTSSSGVDLPMKV